MLRIILFILTFGCITFVQAQASSQRKKSDSSNIKGISDTTYKFHVRNVTVTGNKKTKTYIILRESPVKKGDSIQATQLYAIIQNARNLIYNTVLFTDVSITPELHSGTELSLHITVNERWYVIPVP